MPNFLPIAIGTMFNEYILMTGLYAIGLIHVRQLHFISIPVHLSLLKIIVMRKSCISGAK